MDSQTPSANTPSPRPNSGGAAPKSAAPSPSPSPSASASASAPAPAPGGLRTFWALNGVMFQGALSDNIFKLILMMLVIHLANTQFADDAAMATSRASRYQSIVEGAFILPYILAVSFAGWLGDRFSKSRVTQGTKLQEVATMALAIVALAMDRPWFATGVLFLMGLQSALFSPSKYGILPEILPERRVAWGNGILQGWTFLAIIVGTIVGPALYGKYETHLWKTGVILVALACVGFAVSLLMKPIPAASPTERFSVNPYPLMRRYGREILATVGLKWSVFGMIVWWMVAVMLQGAAVLVAKQILGLTDAQTGIALLPIVVGIGIGCMATGFLSRNRIELGLVPFGAATMCVTSLIVFLATPTLPVLKTLSPEALASMRIWLPALMGLVGLSCGFFIVPLQSFVVQQCDPSIRGGVWATSNVLTALGMILGTLVRTWIIGVTASPGAVFLAGAILMLVTGVVICYRFPTIPLRFFVSVVFRLLYRVRVKGIEKLPATGGALLASNHQSYLDAILIACMTERPVRFVMSEDMYRKWFVKPIARMMESIPISSRQSPRQLIQSLRAARDAIREGSLVGIFPEGQVTRTGMMQPFQRGMTRIMKDIDEPIIPLALDGPYHTAFGLKGGRFHFGFRNPFRRTPLTVAIGDPLPHDISPAVLRHRVMDLMVEAFASRKDEALPIHREAVRTLRRRPSSKDFADHASNGLISRAKLLAATVALGSKLRRAWRDETMVGILLPPSIAATAVNLAATLAGRVTVNLNYTSSLSILEKVTSQCGLRLVVASRAFMAKANLQLPAGLTVVYLEDIRGTISPLDRIAAWLRGRFEPVSWLERDLGRHAPATLDDIVTLIFSSGSTGVPKGVQLTHWNLWSNCAGAWQQIDVPEGSRLLGVLPFFHSFGYMVALWLPILEGFGVVYYPNPLDARMVGNLVEKYRITHFFGTPTFISVYTRRIQSGQFGSLQFVITGAEKLRPAVAEAFERHFGLPLIEGYGSTECSPVVTMSTQDFRGAGFRQSGAKRGTVGHPIPGVTVRVVDLKTGEELPPNEPGMLLVRGPNVMGGYYKMPERTAEVLQDGWYVTGDVARIDEDGFVTITDRLSRFSKIGGEMIPHLNIEEALHQVTGIEETVFAVTGVPDEKKGERLAVLYSIPEGKAREAAELLQKTDLPPLWIPKWCDFVHVNDIPALGTGKLDLQGVREIAVRALTGDRKGVESKA